VRMLVETFEAGFEEGRTTYNDGGVHYHAHVHADCVALLEVLAGLACGGLDAFEVACVPFGELGEVEELRAVRGVIEGTEER
jgi:hypothetical protein